MKKKAPQSKTVLPRRTAPKSSSHSSDVVPSFVAQQNLHEKPASPNEKQKSTAPQNSLQKTPSNTKSKEPVRARLTFGKIFQNLAYACLFVGIVAMLGVIVAAIMIYWPQNESTLNVEQSTTVTTSGSSWMWVVLTGGIPGFMPILQIIVIVAGILIILWGWRAAVRVTRRLVVRIADQFLWPLKLVEPLLLLVVWLLTIIGVWLVVAPEYFISLSVICGAILIFGLICFWIMRSMAGSRLDMTRADLDFYK